MRYARSRVTVRQSLGGHSLEMFSRFNYSGPAVSLISVARLIKVPPLNNNDAYDWLMLAALTVTSSIMVTT